MTGAAEAIAIPAPRAKTSTKIVHKVSKWPLTC